MLSRGTWTWKQVLSRVVMLSTVGGGAAAIPASAQDPCVYEQSSESGQGTVLLVVYNEFESSANTAGELKEGVLITNDLGLAGDWVRQFAGEPGFAGTVAIVDPASTTPAQGYVTPLPRPCAWGPPPPSVTVSIYDQDTLQQWADAEFTPAFMNQVEVDQIPVEDAVFDLHVLIPQSDGSVTDATLRVRKTDGAIAVVSVTTTEGCSSGIVLMSEVECDGAGGWWEFGQLCCAVQLVDRFQISVPNRYGAKLAGTPAWKPNSSGKQTFGFWITRGIIAALIWNRSTRVLQRDPRDSVYRSATLPELLPVLQEVLLLYREQPLSLVWRMRPKLAALQHRTRGKLLNSSTGGSSQDRSVASGRGSQTMGLSVIRRTIMDPRTIVQRRAVWAGLSISLGIAGCQPIFAPVQDLPPELAFVVQDKTLFAQESDDPLTDVAEGAVLDDLSSLGGCWGAFDVLDVQADPPGVDDERVLAWIPDALAVEDYEVYVFDTQTQEMSWSLFQRDVWGLAPIFLTYTGTFSVVGENRLVFTSEGGGFSDPITGEIVSAESEQQFEWLVTLSGDRLKLTAQPDPNQGDQVSRDHLVFRRFECPGESGGGN